MSDTQPIQPMSFDGEALADQIPGLRNLRDMTHQVISGLYGELAEIGPLWHDLRDKPTQQFAASWTQYAAAIRQYTDALGYGIDGRAGDLATAGEQHVNGEQINVDTATGWNGHK